MKIILVEPKDSINIGSVARAMDNFGFTELRLVAPVDYDPKVAARSACWATHILEKAQCFDSLENAVKDLTGVFGFSTREGKNLPQPIVLSEMNTRIEQGIYDLHTTGLLFGPEDTGLTNAHLEHVTDVVRIPTYGQNPSMNLSHAAAVVLYSIFTLQHTTHEPGVNICVDPGAPMEDIAALEKLIFAVCAKNGFFNEHTSKEIPALVGNIFRRGKLSRREVSILQGIFGRSLEMK